MAIEIDPVCGMRVKQNLAAGSEVFRGAPYYFCSQKCAKAFQADPVAYVR